MGKPQDEMAEYYLRAAGVAAMWNLPHKLVLRKAIHWRLRRIPMTAKDLSALFLDTLKDIYYAEKQIYKALPKMAKAANSDQLRAAFEKHHDETEGQIERLEQIFELLGKPARGKKCDAIEGILDEGTEIMDEYKGEPALDAGLLAAAQAVEHYEISRYGTLKTWAGRLSMKDAVKLLDQTLAEEKKTDDALTKLADTAVNAEAA
jgi:ferritin-like metal-binding protein YciE